MTEHSMRLDAYRALFDHSPRPTHAQVDDFVDYVAGKHSWYKHLPLVPPGRTFCLFLDPFAGFQWVKRTNGCWVPERIEDGDSLWHHAMMTTNEYRSRFDFLNVMSTTQPPAIHVMNAFEGADEPLVETPSEIPSEIATVCKVELTGVVHDYASSEWLWSRHFQSTEEMGALKAAFSWPEESGGKDIPRAIKALLAHIDQPPSALEATHFRPPIDTLIKPERLRQRRAMRDAIMQVLDVVYGA